MSFGFPGANTSFENHDVMEESFWPSFTDIMMVIVMVFLLITVSVIMNNFHLVENLKKSIQAEQLSASIAEDTQVENTTLEEHLQSLKQQLTALNIKLSDAKTEVDTSQSALLSSQQNIEKLKTDALKSQQLLEDKDKSITALEKLSKQQLEDKNKQIASLHNQQQSSLDALEIAKQAVVTLEAEDTANKNKFSDLQTQIAKLQTTLTEKSSQTTFLQATLDKTSSQFADLKKLQETEETKLLSLQGEMDSLDKKYQKLLQPARSSKGKFVVTATYSKRGGRSVYRLRVSPESPYESVTRKQLARKLAVLQKKHTTNLYVKIIIPEKSGLSYNEAWRFTNEMQKSYDYYYQENESQDTDVEETKSQQQGDDDSSNATKNEDKNKAQTDKMEEQLKEAIQQ